MVMDQAETRAHTAIIVLCAVVAHGLLLLNDGVYWDGWLIYWMLRERNWADLLYTFAQAGSPVTACGHWLMGSFPNAVFGYRMVAFVCIVLQGNLIYRIALRTNLLVPLGALCIAMFSVLYPAFQVGFELINLPYSVCLVLFLCGVWLALKPEQRCSIARRAIMISGACASFFVSFTVNSLLVFYFGFLLLLRVVWRREGERVHAEARQFIVSEWHFVVLPFVYWIGKKLLFPAHGLYAGYNTFVLSAKPILSSLATFFENAVFGQVNEVVFNVLKHPAAWGVVLIAVLWGYDAFKIESKQFLSDRRKAGWLLTFGLLLLLLAMVPYALVGKSPAPYGWTTRHALLVGLPMGITVTAAIGLVFTREGVLSRPGWVLLAVLFLGFSRLTVANYVEWQERWIKDRSIMVNLSRLPDAANYSVYWVDDQFPQFQESYRFYEWSSIFKAVWGGESRIGLDRRAYAADFLQNEQKYFTSLYSLRDFNPSGRQASLTIKRALGMNKWELCGRYYFYKFGDPKKLNQFLTWMTDVEVRPVP